MQGRRAMNFLRALSTGRQFQTKPRGYLLEKHGMGSLGGFEVEFVCFRLVLSFSPPAAQLYCFFSGAACSFGAFLFSSAMTALVKSMSSRA